MRSGPPRICGTRSSSCLSASSRPSGASSASSATKSRCTSVADEPVADARRDAEGAQQRGVQRGVAEADAVAAQAGRVERVAEYGQRLGGAVGGGRADELDAGLQELAHLAAVRAHAAVGVSEVAELQRRLGGRIARRDEPRDRHGHVRAQREHLAVVVEDAVGGRRAAATAEHRLVFERGSPDLAVAVELEDPAHGLGDVAQLAHLVGQHVARARRDRVDRGVGVDGGCHSCIKSIRERAAPASPPAGGVARSARAWARLCLGPDGGRCGAGLRGRRRAAYAWIGSVATRSMRAPRSRRRSSMRS